MQAYVRLPCVSSNLWQSKVDTKRRILVLELQFQLVDCALEHLRAHANAPNDANAALTPNSATNVHGGGGEHTAFVTAAASLGPAATYASLSSIQHFRTVLLVLALTFIPASITGWLIPNSLVSGVENTGFDGGMVVVRFRVLQGSVFRGPSYRITVRCRILI